MKRKLDTEDSLDQEARTKRRRLESSHQPNDNLLILPDGIVALILSDIYYSTRFCNDRCEDVTTFDAELRQVSRQFCRVIDDSVPCFAMLKLLKNEYQRTVGTKNTANTNAHEYCSPWLTPAEVALITSKHQIDLDKPLPSPSTMPLIALQIIAATIVCELLQSQTDDECGMLLDKKPPQTELIYAVEGVGVFIQTINDAQSPLHGKQILVQKISASMPEDSCGCCWDPRLLTNISTSDPSTAMLLGIEANVWYDEYLDQSRWEKRFPQLDMARYDPILEGCWYSQNDFTTYSSNTLTQLPTNMHYRRTKSLWDQFPTLPPAVYRALAQEKATNTVQLNALINVVQMFKLDTFFKHPGSEMLRQLYSGRIERGNVEYLINDLTILSRCVWKYEGHIVHGRMKSRAAKRVLYVSADGRVGQNWHSDIMDLPLSLTQQTEMNLPVPLTPIDFARMLHVFIGNKIEDFNTEFRFGSNVQYFKKNGMQTKTKSALPPGTEIYCEYNEQLATTIYYNAQFSRHYYNAKEILVLQLLRIQDEIWFRLQSSHGVIDCEVMKRFDLTMAIDLYEYWLGYLAWHRQYETAYLLKCD